MQVERLEATVREYINELKAGYEKRFEELEASAKEYRNKYLEIKEKYDLLVYKRFCRSAEQLLAEERQPLLFATTAKAGEAVAETEQDERETVPAYQRKKPGRKPIDPKLRREERIIDLPESEKICACGAALTRIGEETSEKLHIEPPRIFVERTIRPKYACRVCEGTEDEDQSAVRIAPVEPAIIPKSIASPSVLSTIITQKYELHLPYYRQEKQFRHIGVYISRQDMSNWQQQVFVRLAPLFMLIQQAVKNGPVLQMDETTVQVMGEAGRSDTTKSYMWLACGGLAGKRAIWYEYHPTRSAAHAKTFLSGYSGYLQTDGYAGYDAALRGMPGITHAGCFAHARRKFFEAAKVGQKDGSASEGMRYIRKLYAIEDELRQQNFADEHFLAERRARAGPVLEQFKIWLSQRNDTVPPTTLLGQAIRYSLVQWDKMIVYLESPALTPDNNACENAMRPFVLGRKNWLFNKSPEGAESSCGMFTLIETAKQNGLIPFHYLTALFEKAPSVTTPNGWEKLLPWNIFTP